MSHPSKLFGCSDHMYIYISDGEKVGGIVVGMAGAHVTFSGKL
jgi:hypothetical protein